MMTENRWFTLPFVQWCYVCNDYWVCTVYLGMGLHTSCSRHQRNSCKASASFTWDAPPFKWSNIAGLLSTGRRTCLLLANLFAELLESAILDKESIARAYWALIWYRQLDSLSSWITEARICEGLLYTKICTLQNILCHWSVHFLANLLLAGLHSQRVENAHRDFWHSDFCITDS